MMNDAPIGQTHLVRQWSCTDSDLTTVTKEVIDLEQSS